MIRKHYLLALIMAAVSMNTPPATGQPEQLQQIITHFKFEIKSSEEAVEAPKDLGPEFKYVARFAVGEQKMPWLSRKFNKEYFQRRMKELAEVTPEKYLIYPSFNIKLGDNMSYNYLEKKFIFDIYSSDLSEAKDMTRGSYLVFRYGWPAWQQQEKDKVITQMELQINRFQYDLKEAQYDYEDTYQKIKEEYASLSDEARASLGSRLWQMEIDVVGLQARIERAEALKQKQEHEPLRIELEKICVNAQIEMAGLLAQQEKIRNLLIKDDEYRKRLLPHRDRMRELQMEMDKNMMWLENIKYDYKLSSAIKFDILDNKVMIYPLKER